MRGKIYFTNCTLCNVAPNRGNTVFKLLPSYQLTPTSVVTSSAFEKVSLSARIITTKPVPSKSVSGKARHSGPIEMRFFFRLQCQTLSVALTLMTTLTDVLEHPNNTSGDVQIGYPPKFLLHLHLIFVPPKCVSKMNKCPTVVT